MRRRRDRRRVSHFRRCGVHEHRDEHDHQDSGYGAHVPHDRASEVLAVLSTMVRNSVSVALHDSHNTWGTSFLASAVDARVSTSANTAARTRRTIRIATIAAAGAMRCDVEKEIALTIRETF